MRRHSNSGLGFRISTSTKIQTHATTTTPLLRLYLFFVCLLWTDEEEFQLSSSTTPVPSLSNNTNPQRPRCYSPPCLSCSRRYHRRTFGRQKSPKSNSARTATFNNARWRRAPSCGQPALRVFTFMFFQLVDQGLWAPRWTTWGRGGNEATTHNSAGTERPSGRCGYLSWERIQFP